MRCRVQVTWGARNQTVPTGQGFRRDPVDWTTSGSRILVRCSRQQYHIRRGNQALRRQPATRPPGTNLGDPISPMTGYTVPSAGSQVLLHNGDPLYGPDGPPSFAPIMRQTSVVIFVGLAAPPMQAN